MNYLVVKENLRTAEVDVFIPSTILAERFNRKQNHVDAKIKAIMRMESDSIVEPFKTDSRGMTVFLEYGDYSKLNIFCNKTLVEYIFEDWGNKSNTNIINEILSDFNKKLNELVPVEIEEEKEDDIMEEYYQSYCDMEEEAEVRNINIEIFEYEGVNSVYARDLYKALDLDYYANTWEKWSREQIVNSEIYKEYIDYTQITSVSNSEEDPKYSVDYIITLDVAKELTVLNLSKYSSEVRNYLKAFGDRIISNDTSAEENFVNNLKLNIYHVERYLPTVLSWKNAEVLLPKLLDRCMDEIDTGEIKVDVVSAVIRTCLKIVDKEKDTTKKELLNRQITEWMIKRAQIYAGIISAVKTENARLKSLLAV